MLTSLYRTILEICQSKLKHFDLLHLSKNWWDKFKSMSILLQENLSFPYLEHCVLSFLWTFKSHFTYVLLKLCLQKIQCCNLHSTGIDSTGIDSNEGRADTHREKLGWGELWSLTEMYLQGKNSRHLFMLHIWMEKVFSKKPKDKNKLLNDSQNNWMK